jgi:hypothetical protein
VGYPWPIRSSFSIAAIRKNVDISVPDRSAATEIRSLQIERQTDVHDRLLESFGLG